MKDKKIKHGLINHSGNQQVKDTKIKPITKDKPKVKRGFDAERKRVYQYLQHNTATATMVHKAIDVDQKNICRYKRYYEKRGLLWEVKKTHCKETGVKAWYLTTDAKLAEHLNLL